MLNRPKSTILICCLESGNAEHQHLVVHSMRPGFTQRQSRLEMLARCLSLTSRGKSGPITTSDVHRLALYRNSLRWLTHEWSRHSFGHATHFVIRGLLAVPHIFRCTAKHDSSASSQLSFQMSGSFGSHLASSSRNNIEGGNIWMLSPGDLGLPLLPFAAQRQQLHQSEGVVISCDIGWLFLSFCGQPFTLRFISVLHSGKKY